MDWVKHLEALTLVIGLQKVIALPAIEPDGGLLIPESVPDVADDLGDWRGLSFVPFAQALIAKFSAS